MNKISKNSKCFSSLFAAIAICVFSFSILSCNFMFENVTPNAASEQTSNPDTPTTHGTTQTSDKTTFNLIINPSFITDSTDNSRSAYPQFSTTQLAGLNFHAVCTDAFGDVEGTYNSENGKIVYTITCNNFTNKTITFLVKDGDGNALWFAQKASVTYTRGTADSPTTIEITPALVFKPYTSALGNTGTLPKGNIDLDLSAPDGSKIVCKIYDSTGSGDTLGESGESGKTITVTGTTNICSITTESGIDYGEYVAKIFIYKDGSTTSTPEYRQEKIVVWPGITTNAWYLTDGSKHNRLQIAFNNEEIKIYVKGTNPAGIYSATGLPSMATVADASNSNAGTILAPLQTINAAIAKCTSETANYKIICDGDLAGFNIGTTSSAKNAKITVSGGGNSTNYSNISSQILINSEQNITLENLNIVLSSSQDALNVKYVNSLLSLNNCKIQTEDGYGINFNTNTILRLTDTLINGNNDKAVYMYQGQLIIQGSTYIPLSSGKNYVDLSTTATILVDGPLDTTHTTVATVVSTASIGTQIISVQNGADLETESQRFQYKVFPKIINTQGKLAVEKELYVASTSSTPAGSSTGSGSATSPLDTVTAAIEKIKDVANISGCAGDYKIHITGTILESDHTIFLKNGTGADNTLGAFTGSTLTICGTNKTTDILDGDDDHTVIQITGSGLQVTIENLTIQNGNGNCGGGIVVTAGATLKLGTGSVITKNANTSGYGGGGLYVEGSTLFMYSDALIGYDASEIASDSDTARANGGNIETAHSYGGGGIFAYLGASIWIGYTAENVPDTSENVCKISGNYVANNREGGGIYISSNCILNMCKGTISYNYADGKGGAIYCDNELKMKGSVHIPFIAAKKNDVYLPSGKKITITGTLTPPTEANGITATITPATYDNTTVLLKDDDSGTTVAANYDKFTVTPNGTINWKIDSEGKLYVPVQVKVNDVTYTKNADCIAAITDSSLNGQAITVTVLEADVNVFGPAATEGTILYAISNTTAKTVDLIVDKNANIHLPADCLAYFMSCSKLYHVDLAGIDTSGVTSMQGMFASCFSATDINHDAELDIRSFETTNVNNIFNMFYGCSNLKSIIVSSGFVTTGLTTTGQVFAQCESIRGGAGTNWSPYQIDQNYAQIDGSGGNPGYFTSYVGKKLPSKPKEVGDIVFNDGSATPYTSDMTITDEQKDAAIALIFYKGTELNSDDSEGNADTTTIRTLGVGLKHNKSGLAWCLSGANAHDKKITTINCPVSGGSYTMTFTGDKNGIDNLEQMGEFSGVTDTGTAENYPAFYFGKNYATSTVTNISASSDFATGWYLPSIAELKMIQKNRTNSTTGFNLDDLSEALGGNKFESDFYWSSTQHESIAGEAYQIWFSDGGWYQSGKELSSTSGLAFCGCCIREF